MPPRTNWARIELEQIMDSQGIAAQIGFPPGAIWYVHNTGASTNSGKSRDSTVATIAQAIAKASANMGHVIYVLPGHTENISTATSLVINKAGVIILGGGVGYTRPVLNFTAVVGSIEMDAASCMMKNIIFNASFPSVAVAVNVDAAYCTLDDCFWTFEDTGDEFILGVDVDGFDYFTFKNCFMTTEVGAGASTHGIRLDTSDYSQILNSKVVGTYSTGALVVEGALCKELQIMDSVFHNSAEPTIITIAATTGTAHNCVVSGVGAIANIWTFGNMQTGRCWSNDAVANRGTQLLPAVSPV